MRIRKAIVASVLGCSLVSVADVAIVASGNRAGVAVASDGVLTPEQQGALDRQKRVVAGWAGHPLLIDAVAQQNARGPIAGMDDASWRALALDAEAVHALDITPASVWLTEKVKANHGVLTDAVLYAAKGELVAFVDKPDAYDESGHARFDVAMQGKEWQGEPKPDPARDGREIEIATPVRDAGKPIGVLVVSVAVDRLVPENL